MNNIENLNVKIIKTQQQIIIIIMVVIMMNWEYSYSWTDVDEPRRCTVMVL